MPLSLPAQAIHCPPHPEWLSIDEAWDLALLLLYGINTAEDREGLDAYVTERDVLDELVSIRRSADRVRAKLS